VRFSLAQGLPEVGSVTAEDFLDDGTRIALAVTIDRGTRSATFDFSGTGPEVGCAACPSVPLRYIVGHMSLG
jgi:N-methylhydantoinase B/oxoprolinase/acetone carboxylase alpha subunit